MDRHTPLIRLPITVSINKNKNISKKNIDRDEYANLYPKALNSDSNFDTVSFVNAQTMTEILKFIGLS